MDQIKFVLNGQEQAFDGSVSERLLDVLRNTYHLTSVKCGCKEGECGACAVLQNGVLVNSCCVAMGAVESSEIITMEGFRTTKRYEVLSKAFAEISAVQCGFCIPGMVLAAEALLSKNANPSDDQIREGLSGNLCRCTGYNAIVKAITNAAKEGKGLW